MPHVADSILGHQHPYYPTSLRLPGYAPPAIPFGSVLAVFFSGAAALFVACWFVSGTSVLGPNWRVESRSTQGVQFRIKAALQIH